MRSVLAIVLTLSLSAVAFAQDNTNPAIAQNSNKAYATTTTLSQQDLEAMFQADSKVSQRNILSQQESKSTVGGSTCYTFVGTDGTAYQLCY